MPISSSTPIPYLRTGSSADRAWYFTNPKARLALEYAFDYNAFINGLLKGFARPAQGPITHYAEGHDNALPIYQTDINKAKQLFAEAGVKPGTTLTMWYPSGDPTQQDVALVTQGQLAQCGITVKTQAIAPDTYSTNYYGTEPLSQQPGSVGRHVVGRLPGCQCLVHAAVPLQDRHVRRRECRDVP